MKPIYKKWLVVLMLLWGFPAAALIFANGLVLGPQRKMVKHVEAELKEKSQLYDSYMLTSSVPVREVRAKKIAKITKQLDQFVTNTDTLDDLTFNISKLASNCGVSSFKSKGLDDGAFSTMANYDRLGRMTLFMDFGSSFNEFARLINLLERHEPIVIVNRFMIMRSLDQSGIHRMNIHLSVYVRREIEEEIIEEEIELPELGIDI